jgi:wyosine [tRNA(Phe)-imidazoG37] synthetase (radical SAM superfamily)
MNARREYFPREEMIAEFEQALANHKPNEIDWITFIGSGETTLHAGIGWLIQQVKARTHLPVAVITNGSLLYLPEIRHALSAADAVMPSLDAGNAQLYRKINRPHPDIEFNRLVEGLASFRNEYQGKLWVEVMLVCGLNDTESALQEIAATLTNIRPDEIHIVQPDRPAVEPWVQPPDEEGLLRARAILGDAAKIIHPASGSFDVSGYSSLVEAVIGIITRHPMREDELIETLRHSVPGEMKATLQELEKSGKAQVVERYGIRFWNASPAHYPKSLSGNVKKQLP